MTRQEAANHAAALGYQWIAMDEDRQWFAFANKPHIVESKNRRFWYDKIHTRVCLDRTPIDYTGDWKGSLTEGEV